MQEAQLRPLEATAWENGFVPEARGIASDQLEFRIQGSLPPLAYIVSQTTGSQLLVGEDLMRRFDAGDDDHIGCEIGSQNLEATPRCMNTKSMERQGENSLLHMWSDHGPRPRMSVSVSP